MVDAGGKPLVVYHGTDADFTAFKDDGEPIFLAPDPQRSDRYADREGGNVMPFYASVENPATMRQYEEARRANKGPDARKKAVQALKSQGYDGVIVAVNHQEYKKLDEKYFKSILSNKGVLVDVKGIYRNHIKGITYWSL